MNVELDSVRQYLMSRSILIIVYNLRCYSNRAPTYTIIEVYYTRYIKAVALGGLAPRPIRGYGICFLPVVKCLRCFVLPR